MVVVNHVFTAPGGDGTNTTLVQPSHWNSSHAVTALDAVVIGGNSAGVAATVSSGSLLLAGGNNITLSQNGQSITFSAGAGGTANQSIGMSNVGNTSGTTGVATGPAVQVVLAGGTNITLSQSLDGASATVTISADNYITTGALSGDTSLYRFTSADSQLRFTSADSQLRFTSANSQLQFTSANSNFVQGTAVFAGTNATGTIASDAISVSVAAPIPIGTAVKSVATVGSTGTITRYAPEDHQHLGVPIVSVVGNTSGTTTQGAMSLILAGGPNITLSASTDGGAMTVSVSAGAAGAFSGGISNLGNTTGTSGMVSAREVLVASGDMMISGSNDAGNGSATLTISAGSYMSGLPFGAMGFFGQTLTYAVSQSSYNVFPVIIPRHLTVSRVDGLVSLGLATNAGSSAALQISLGLAVYTRTGQTLSSLTLSIVGLAAAVSEQSGNSTASLTSLRRASWAMNMNFTPGEYWLAAGFQTATSGNNVFAVSVLAVTSLNARFAGMLGAATNASNNVYPFYGLFSAQSSAPPVSLHITDVIGSTSNEYKVPVIHFVGTG